MKNFTSNLLLILFIIQCSLCLSQSNATGSLNENKTIPYARIYSVESKSLNSASLKTIKNNISQEKYFTLVDFCEKKNNLLIGVSSEIPMRTSQIEILITDKILRSISKTDVVIKSIVDKNDFQLNCNN